uniref:PIP49_C domain-containing protein n=1 Tax=Parastrongyloides trichosuri TaxID=131310 RepID=A0A0N4Z1W0_PARTI
MYLCIFIFFLLILVNTTSNKFNSTHDDDDDDIDYTSNSTEGNDVLEQLCYEYKNDNIVGESCEDICSSFLSSNQIKYLEGKNKFVISFNFNSTPRIFKASKKYSSDYSNIINDMNVTFEEYILRRVNNQTMLQFPLSHFNHVINMIYPPYKEKKQKYLNSSERETINRLLQQPEYINFKILRLSGIVPKVISNCGHFYEVENLVPFKMKSYYMNLKNKILIHLMGTAKLFYEFLNEPLEWCDAEFNNLALSQQYGKRFLILDADKLFTKTKLDNIFNSRFCSSDEDCILGDCLSSCDNTTNTCTGRINENLDIFCDKMIFQLYGKYYNKNNKFLSACLGNKGNKTKRINELRLAWAWNLPDV